MPDLVRAFLRPRFHIPVDSLGIIYFFSYKANQKTAIRRLKSLVDVKGLLRHLTKSPKGDRRTFRLFAAVQTPLSGGFRPSLFIKQNRHTAVKISGGC